MIVYLYVCHGACAHLSTSLVSVMSSSIASSSISDEVSDVKKSVGEESDSDLGELYTSFEFEDDVSIDVASRSTENVPAISATPLHPGAQLSTFSRLSVRCSSCIDCDGLHRASTDSFHAYFSGGWACSAELSV